MNDTTFQGNGSVKYVPVVVNAKPKPITNADAVRAMTDEELAALFFHHSIVCVPGKRPNPEDCVGGCEHCWLDWLKEEAEI